MKKKILSIIGLMLILSIFFVVASNLVKWKHSGDEYRIFYEKGDEIDVLFFGASVVHYAIYPMQLWNDYGITSYNMANDSERLQMTYYDMINAFDYCHPKMVVVDLTGIGWAGAKRDGTLKDHAFLDSVPLSRNKIKEINAIFEGSERLEYIFPFELYHSRWSELDADDFFFNTRDIEYGAERHAGIIPFEAPNPDMYEESRVNDIELERTTIENMIALCKEKGIDIIFTYMPQAQRGGDQKNREVCANMMKDYDVDFYDFLYVDFIDWSCDTVEGAHLNFYGSEKMTDYLGKMLSETYAIPDRRNDSSINAGWNEDYITYTNEVNEFVSETYEEYINAGGVPFRVYQ